MIERRTPIARSAKPIKRSPLKRGRSERALAQLPERARVVDAAWERDRGQCQAEHLVGEIRCSGPIDVHELCPRSAFPGGELILSNTVCICRAHHRWVDAEPALAHEVGLHLFSWEVTR